MPCMRVGLSHQLGKGKSNCGDCCSQLCRAHMEYHVLSSATHVLPGVIYGPGKVIEFHSESRHCYYYLWHFDLCFPASLSALKKWFLIIIVPRDKKDGAEVTDITSACSVTWGHLPIIFILLEKNKTKQKNLQLPFQPVLGVFPYSGCILGMNWINSINAKKAHWCQIDGS